MNGDPFSSRDLSIQRRAKASLLSTYLVSDDEDDQQTESHSDPNECSIRIEVPVPRSSTTLSNHSNGCDTTTSYNSIDAPSPERALSPTKPRNLWSDDTIDSSTPRRSQYRVTFEIIKAKTVTAIEKGIGRNRFERRKYVSYTVLIKRVPGLETKPAVIERRYSDFLALFNGLKKRYPNLLKEVHFPRKHLFSNFSPELIAERSAAFQSFLTYCLSVPELRASKEFAAFLYHPELNEAKRCLQSIHLEEAANLFENVMFILDKLTIHSGRPSSTYSAQLVHTLCCLIGCWNAVDNTSEAKKLAERTFQMLFENAIICIPNTNGQNIYEVNNLFESSDLVLPLILLSLRLRWVSGQQKILLENKLEEMCRQRSLPRNFDSQPTLLEQILKKDFSPILD